MSRSRKALLWAATFCIALVAMLVGFEAMLRVLIAHRTPAEAGSPLVRTSVPGLEYRLIPNHTQGAVRTNEYGLRVRPPDSEPVRRKVLLIGDSVAYGMGVRYERSIAPMLESLLTERTGQRVAVWNAGVPGYNSTQEAILLDELAPIVKPDIVVVQFCLNDYLDAPRLDDDGVLDATPRTPAGASVSLAGLMYQSRVLIFAKEKLRDLQQLKPEMFPRWMHYSGRIPAKPGWARAKEGLLHMQQTATRGGAKFLVFLIPLEQQVRVGERNAQEDLAHFAARSGFDFLDLYEPFRAHWRERLYVDYWSNVGTVDKLHPNERGHALAAWEIARAMLGRPELLAAPATRGAGN